MKAVVQRVTRASVSVDGEIVGKIGKGYLVLLGVGEGDDKPECDRLAAKLVKLRIFEDCNGKTNLSICDVGGEMLIVSQFTLYADCSHGNRPSFTNAAKPDVANELYEYFCKKVSEAGINVQKGIFGADMKVDLLNDGPFTVILENI
ncbi:MAG: D-tyrosyl-tRNA(Tyr) deacylase [Oscillospiraceae bacterium]|nr:D-tyrosyl-tRNA(Tyr) deacylase [Oscillospiraceae bacterium]